MQRKSSKTEEEKKTLLEKLEKKKSQPEPEQKIEGIPKLKSVKPKEEPVEEKKQAAATKKTTVKKVVKKNVEKKAEVSGYVFDIHFYIVLFCKDMWIKLCVRYIFVVVFRISVSYIVVVKLQPLLLVYQLQFLLNNCLLMYNM